MNEAESLEAGLAAVRSLFRDFEGWQGWEQDQLSWRLNDGLEEAGIDPVPVYVELIRRGETWYLVPLAWLHSAAVPAIPALLEMRDRLPRDRLSNLITGFGAGAVPALLAYVSRRSDEWDENAIVAIDMLAEIGPSAAAAIPALVGILPGVQENGGLLASAAQALRKIGVAGEEVVRALGEVLGRVLEEGWCSQCYTITVVEVLGEFGPAARAAEPYLRLAAADPNLDFSRAASEALAKVLSEDPSGA